MKYKKFISFSQNLPYGDLIVTLKSMIKRKMMYFHPCKLAHWCDLRHSYLDGPTRINKSYMTEI